MTAKDWELLALKANVRHRIEHVDRLRERPGYRRTMTANGWPETRMLADHIILNGWVAAHVPD
jgi:hypothetical protein